MPKEKAEKTAGTKMNRYLKRIISETNRLEVLCAKLSTDLASETLLNV